MNSRLTSSAVWVPRGGCLNTSEVPLLQVLRAPCVVFRYLHYIRLFSPVS